MTKRISDPVHGTIELTDFEQDIVSTRVFQRLHNIRQLGLAQYVFPAANYSRFAHSVGACHNAQRILAAVEKNTRSELDPARKRDIRAAALLHDVGHYPFSHAFEHEIREAYSSQSLSDNSQFIPATYDHEEMGALLLRQDKQLTKVFKKHGVEPDAITGKFDFGLEPFARILSSDLDCDRLDYLKRTAHHTGLPYGNVDINYLIDQATEVKGSFCFTTKAMRAVDHMLVARYFDYIQVPFHKHVVALEWSLQVVIRELLRLGKFDCTKSGMQKAIENSSWHTFDDNLLLSHARSLGDGINRQHTRTQTEEGLFKHIEAILYRQPAVLVGVFERVGKDVHDLDYAQVRSAVDDFTKTHKLSEHAMFVWKPKDVSLIKASPGATDINASSDEELSEEELQEFVHIAVEEGPTPISKVKEALMSEIFNFRYKAIRVYSMARNDEVLLESLRAELQIKLRELGMRAPPI